jgi:uncharacterized Zn-finger protein
MTKFLASNAPSNPLARQILACMIPAVPPNQSVSMPVEAPEIVETDQHRVSCDGGGGALGHPRVYLEMGDEHFVECPYCDKRFVLKAGAGHH